MSGDEFSGLQEDFMLVMSAAMDAAQETDGILGASIQVIPSGTQKIPAVNAGYMELSGVTKDGECAIVSVEGGISKERGCCNVYTAKPDAPGFSCGNCKYES